jgi:hypothetical protein
VKAGPAKLLIESSVRARYSRIPRRRIGECGEGGIELQSSKAAKWTSSRAPRVSAAPMCLNFSGHLSSIRSGSRRTDVNGRQKRNRCPSPLGRYCSTMGLITGRVVEKRRLGRPTYTAAPSRRISTAYNPPENWQLARSRRVPADVPRQASGRVPRRPQGHGRVDDGNCPGLTSGQRKNSLSARVTTLGRLTELSGASTFAALFQSL